MTKFIYKICNETKWNYAKKKGVFAGTKKDILDGYIHFSKKNQIKSTLKKYYIRKNKLVLLKIKTLKLNVVWEKSRGGILFPHLYSNLNLNFVKKVCKIILRKDGSYFFPESF